MTKSTNEYPHEKNKEGKAGYASVNGLTLYYEIHGAPMPEEAKRDV